MRVLYFAQAADLAGCREEVWPEPGPLSDGELWEKLTARHPGLQTIQGQCRLAVNQQFLPSGANIPPHSDVAVLPPVSGG